MAIKKAAKKTAKKAAAKAAPKRIPAIRAKMTKAQIIQAIIDQTGLSKKDVTAVLAAQGELLTRHMKRNGSGEFQIPDTGVKVNRVKKPARKSRMGRNPATGEAIKIAAKPAYTGIKVTALKALKDSVKA